MDHILMLVCFLIMVAALCVSVATVNGRAMLEDAIKKWIHNHHRLKRGWHKDARS
jgi:cadmium resistance protein CadD (predicted permease)